MKQVQVCYLSASEANNSFAALKAIKTPASEAMCRPNYTYPAGTEDYEAFHPCERAQYGTA